MLIFYGWIIWLASVSSVASKNGSYTSDVNVIRSFCLDAPASCSCNRSEKDFSYTYLCSDEVIKDKVLIKLRYYNFWTVYECQNVSSLELIPNLTNLVNSSYITLSNCMVPSNKSLNELTSLISNKIDYLVIHLLEKTKFNLNKNYFEGFKNLEKLNILRHNNAKTAANITTNVFENLVHLKTLELYNLPLPIGIFDPLKDLQGLIIHVNIDCEFKQKLFNTQRNLVHLQISCENNCSLDPLLFTNLVELQTLKIINFKIPRKLIGQMKNLLHVTILHSDFVTLPDDLFKASKTIKFINICKNKLKELPKDFFLDQASLIGLNLKRNLISNLVDGLFEKTINLEELNLSHNKLTSISRILLINLANLTRLLLDNNNLVTIDDSFKKLPKLEIINLQHNKINQSTLHKMFEEMSSLKKINLSYNQLVNFIISNQTKIENLQKLDLSHNNISHFIFEHWKLFLPITKTNTIAINLSFNNITEFKVEAFQTFARLNPGSSEANKVTFNLDENPIFCDCNALELYQLFKKSLDPYDMNKVFDIGASNFRCLKPDHLYNETLYTLKPTDLTCDIIEDCPKECKCKKRSVDATIIFECSSYGYSKLPIFQTFENLNLTNKELHASCNKVAKIQLIDIPDDLKLLDLRNNSLELLTNDVIERLKTINQLYLSRNPWTCGCSAAEFVYFFHLFRSNIIDADDMICKDGRSFKVLEAKNMCVQLIEVFVALLMGTSLMGLFSTLLVIFKKQIKIWLYAHNCCLWWVSEEEADKEMIYDAFFVFSHFDDNFVTDLIMDLEEKSFKCCVHHRDWPAGEMIVTLALNSIRTSRRIIVVLSPKFVESNWATWEFRVSLIHAFNQKRSRVLVIIYGDVSLINDLDDDLKTYIAFNTYLDAEDKWFDEKLFYAMPHKTVPAIKQKRKLTSTRSELMNSPIQEIQETANL
ncbi:unnamed protein product [Diamesa serratosioi]